jgi:hypothetical protein
MKTQTVTVNGTDYTVGPLSFEQYEKAFLSEDGGNLDHPKASQALADSLANAVTYAGATNPDFIPAGDALQLIPIMLDLSGLKNSSPDPA